MTSRASRASQSSQSDPLGDPRLKALGALSVLVTLLIGLQILTLAGSYVTTSSMLEAFPMAQEGDAEALERVEQFDALGGVLALAGVGLYLLAVIFFLIWVVRANRNARCLGAVGMRFTPGWAAGWFFVPFANFFRPVQIVQELWKTSGSAEEAPRWQEIPASPLVSAWWIFFLGINMFQRYASKQSIAADTVSEFVAAQQLGMWADLAWIVPGVLAIMVVRGVTRRQRDQRESLSSSIFA